ncbi:MAG: GSCFA domain-containing protein [Muribaculaceae bacterium]|nr:GSCFA domain-containing protein [Muribaculaceae bacterium]
MASELKFRTEIESRATACQLTIDHSTPIMLIGSCFSDNIGRMLQSGLFCTSVNPVGILFNPLSIARSLEAIASGSYPTSVNELVSTADNGLYHSLDFHGAFSSAEPDNVLKSTKEAIINARDFLKQAAVLVVTLGSNHAYIHRERNHVVANCHRLPAADFEERILGVEECKDAILRAFNAARSLNPDIRMVLTVSPVRHTAYTLRGNSLSKATLHIAIDEAIREYPQEIDYFPAYEIMIDDLRDYRFYAEDLKHPSELAVKYIFNKFQSRYMTKQTAEFARKCNSLTARLAHRPMTDATDATERFNNDTIRIANELTADAPAYTKTLISKIISRLEQ